MQQNHFQVELKDYVDYLEKYLNVPVSMVSNGPGREQLIDLTEGKFWRSL
jgi:adenylosuccinate synthase